MCITTEALHLNSRFFNFLVYNNTQRSKPVTRKTLHLYFFELVHRPVDRFLSPDFQFRQPVKQQDSYCFKDPEESRKQQWRKHLSEDMSSVGYQKESYCCWGVLRRRFEADSLRYLRVLLQYEPGQQEGDYHGQGRDDSRYCEHLPGYVMMLPQ